MTPPVRRTEQNDDRPAHRTRANLLEAQEGAASHLQSQCEEGARNCRLVDREARSLLEDDPTQARRACVVANGHALKYLRLDQSPHELLAPSNQYPGP